MLLIFLHSRTGRVKHQLNRFSPILLRGSRVTGPMTANFIGLPCSGQAVYKIEPIRYQFG